MSTARTHIRDPRMSADGRAFARTACGLSLREFIVAFASPEAPPTCWRCRNAQKRAREEQPR